MTERMIDSVAWAEWLDGIAEWLERVEGDDELGTIADVFRAGAVPGTRVVLLPGLDRFSFGPRGLGPTGRIAFAGIADAIDNWLEHGEPMLFEHLAETLHLTQSENEITRLEQLWEL